MLTDAPASADLLAVGDPILLFLDRAILRERRMEALWKRASRGPFPEELRETLRFESYEDREHARILRRHRGTYVRALGLQRRAPGSRASKVGRTLSAASAFGEALSLKAASRGEYTGMWRLIEDRFLRKFVQVLAGAEDRSLPALLEAARPYGIRPKPPSAERAEQLQPVLPLLAGANGPLVSSVA
jgi:hypothetical protein